MSTSVLNFSLELKYPSLIFIPVSLFLIFIGFWQGYGCFLPFRTKTQTELQTTAASQGQQILSSL